MSTPAWQRHELARRAGRAVTAVELRPMRPDPAELTEVDELLRAAYGGRSRRREVALYLSVQPDGWFVITDGGQLIGAAGTIGYGSFCWLGLVATRPDRQRQGLATRLSEHVMGWARERGCRTIALDASDAGRPVYERLGFQVVGATVELELPGPLQHRAPQDVPSRDAAEAGIRPAAEADGLLGLDRRAFGAPREGLLRRILAEPGSSCQVLYRDGRAAGYLIAREGMLGPGCAPDAAAAGGLVRA
ncbi:MAG: GNAT family N-acetyltransferase, partial [Actinobacteria bacterium]|nr:GNAT family N-acetyltransferase [Actinomycetota bacterium]